MAQLLPAVFGTAKTSAAERKLGLRFERELPSPSVLLHSVGLVRHPTKRWGEADFVLLTPGGVLCIEVKGGLVSRRDGVWTFTDRHGRTSEKNEGPFDQAGSAAGALQQWIAESGLRREDGRRFQVGYAVMAPDCLIDVEGPDVDSGILFDQRNADEPMPDFVARLADYWQDRLESRSSRS